MKKTSKLPAHDEPLMAQAVADKVGATKRQIQLWTDGGAIRCLPETDRQGRGRQRLYDQNELPFAALVAALAAYQIPIGELAAWCRVVRLEVRDYSGIREYVDMFKGDEDSYIVLSKDLNEEGYSIGRRGDGVRITNTAIVINIHKTMSPFVR